MFAIFAYAFGIMYTPGPVNLLSLHGGLHGLTRRHIGFFIGVGCALFIMFVSLSLVSHMLISPRFLPYISLVGCVYILYVAWHILRADVSLESASPVQARTLSFWNGLLIQLLNPKGFMATLPIVTIQFPAEGIHGMMLLFWVLILSAMGGGAPASYSLIGLWCGKQLHQPVYFKMFNRVMAILLIGVVCSMGYESVYLKLTTV
ncbi:LysE family translocator [Celerinatantimonas sp. YJH-8]|uniref:LysE family translocator n=1 Tax=Celerinatantimonas sp. YJH-8 TaxID=3228714 RepID=UPI0038C10295